MRDFFDREIEVGDLVTWPVRRASRMWMNAGTVMAVSADELSVCKRDTGRTVTLKNAKTVISMRGVI